MQRKKTAVTILVLLLAFGLMATSAWAGGRGWGMGRGYGMGHGYGGSNRWGHMPGPYMRGFDQNDPRYKMFKETEKERNELYQKHTELSNLMAAPTVDEEKVKALHKEITQLQNQMTEKHFQFALEFKKNNPDWRPGYARGWGRGMGFGPGRGCW
ncbi:MAG: hypothetical protein V3V52_08765 [Candidatus Adiutricales bacterium]